MVGAMLGKIKKVDSQTASAELEAAQDLHPNFAADTPFDLEIYGANANLHGGHLQTPASDDMSVVTHGTPEGEFWLQVVRKQGSGESLEDVAFRAYQDLLLRAQEVGGELVRIWNYIPAVLARENSEIRYHLFNAGRLRAWRKYGPKSADGQLMLPAATGIGSAEEALVLRAFISSHPVIRLQNSRQIPPAQYSSRYGALPPAFSRASILLKPNRHIMFVSGTAAITGENSTDLGDPIAQTRQSLSNIRNLADRENCSIYGYKGRFTFADLKSMRVYVKHPDQFHSVLKVVAEEASCPITYRQCDICRDELLVEIECIFETAI